MNAGGKVAQHISYSRMRPEYRCIIMQAPCTVYYLSAIYQIGGYSPCHCVCLETDTGSSGMVVDPVKTNQLNFNKSYTLLGHLGAMGLLRYDHSIEI